MRMVGSCQVVVKLTVAQMDGSDAATPAQRHDAHVAPGLLLSASSDTGVGENCELLEVPGFCHLPPHPPASLA